MELSGTVAIRKPPRVVAETLIAPATVKAAVPFCKSLRTLKPGHHIARIEHPSLPIGVDVDLSVLPIDEGVAIAIRAGNLVTGKVRSDLRITLHPTPNGCRLTWAGEMAATGLAKTLLATRETSVQDRVLGMFRRIKARIEAPVQAAPEPGAA